MNRLPKRDGTGAEIQLQLDSFRAKAFLQQPPEFLFFFFLAAALITFGANERRFITGRSAVFNPQLAGRRLVCLRRKLQKHPSCLPDHGNYPTSLNTISMTFEGGNNELGSEEPKQEVGNISSRVLLLSRFAYLN